jgi:hypothetical protein
MAFCGYQLSRPKHLLEFVTLLVFMLGTSLAPVPVLAGPLDGDGSGTADVPLAANPERESENAPAVSLADTGFEAFAASLPAAEAEQPVGLYAPGVLAQPVVEQPVGNPAYISPADGELTHFGLAAGFGSTGLLAHNTAAGALFYQLRVGQVLYLVHGDKSIHAYRITNLRHYQALSPYSPYSDFVDLDHPGNQLSVTDLFFQIFGVQDRLVLQTCIAANGVDSWGRLFLIAEPVEPGLLLRPTVPVRSAYTFS